MIENAKEKSGKIFNGNLKLLCENILQNNLPTDHYDIISCAYGLKTFNVQQLELLAEEVTRILKPKGKFSFVEVSIPDHSILYFAYKVYLSKIIPILGRLFLGNPEDYKMLWIYTEKFENSKGVKNILKDMD